MPVQFPGMQQYDPVKPFRDVGDFLFAMANQRHQEQAQARDFGLRQQAQKRADQLAGLQDERLAEQHRVSMAKEARLKAADKLDFVNKYQGELGAGEFQRAEARKNTIGPELGYSETWKPPAGQPPQFPDSPEAQARLAGDAAAQEQARMATQRAEAEQALAQGVPPEEGPLQDPRFAQRQAMAATPPAEGMETSDATLARASLAGTQAADAALADRQRMLAQRGPWNMLQAAARARVDEGPMQTPESARATAEATAMTPEMLAKYAEEKLNYPSRMAAYQAGGQRTGSFDGGPGFTMDMSSLRYSAQMADANDMKTVLLPRGVNLAIMFQGHADKAKTSEEKALFSAAAEIVPSFIDNLIGEVKSGTLTKEKAGAQFNASYDKIVSLIMKPGMSFDQKMALVRAGAASKKPGQDLARERLDLTEREQTRSRTEREYFKVERKYGLDKIGETTEQFATIQQLIESDNPVNHQAAARLLYQITSGGDRRFSDQDAIEAKKIGGIWNAALWKINSVTDMNRMPESAKEILAGTMRDLQAAIKARHERFLPKVRASFTNSRLYDPQLAEDLLSRSPYYAAPAEMPEEAPAPRPMPSVPHKKNGMGNGRGGPPGTPDATKRQADIDEAMRLIGGRK